VVCYIETRAKVLKSVGKATTMSWLAMGLIHFPVHDLA
jgi:hypothetical protein